MRARGTVLRAVAVLLCLTAAIAILALLSGDFDDVHAQVLLSTTALALYGLLAAPSTLLVEEGRDTALAAVALTLTVTGAGLALVLIWALWDSDGADDLLKTWAVVSEFALATAQVAANRPRPADSDRIRTLRALATLTAVSLAVMGAIAVLDGVESGDYYRAMGVIGVLDVLALALVPVLRRSEAASEHAARFACTTETGQRIEVELRRGHGPDAFGAAAAEAARQSGLPVRSVERLGPERLTP